MTSREINRVVYNIKNSSFGKCVAILHNIYAQGYADGHSACCDELAVADGDEVVTMDIDELRRRMSLGNTVDDQIEKIFEGIKEIKRSEHYD